MCLLESGVLDQNHSVTHEKICPAAIAWGPVYMLAALYIQNQFLIFKNSSQKLISSDK